MTTNPEITIKRNSVLSWAVLIDGEDKGSVHAFDTRRGRMYCHDLRIARGARFTSREAAVRDLVNIATAAH